MSVSAAVFVYNWCSKFKCQLSNSTHGKVLTTYTLEYILYILTQLWVQSHRLWVTSEFWVCSQDHISDHRIYFKRIPFKKKYKWLWCKLHEGMDFCLFSSLLYPWHLNTYTRIILLFLNCLVQGKHSKIVF